MSDVYKIGVAIALTNGMSPVLSVISRQLLGINASTKQIEQNIGRWKVALVAAGAGFAGAAVWRSLSKLADHGTELLDQQNQLLRLGISQNDVLATTAKYWKDVAKAVPTSSVVEYLKTVKELRAVTGDMKTAEDFAPKALKFDALLSNVMGKEIHGELYRLLRAGEMKGIATDPGKLNDLIQQAYSYIAAFGGKLTAAMIQNLAVRGGTAWMNADLKKSFGPMAVLAAEMGASGGGGSSSSPGVVLYQLQQLMMGAHTMSKQQAAIFQQLGLLDMSKTTKTGFGGGSLQLQPGAIKGSTEYAGNVPGWAKDVVWPALVKASHGSEALLQNLLAKIAPTTNMAKAVELFGNPEFLKQQQKDLGMADLAEPLKPAYSSFVKNNPKGVSESYDAQYNSMISTMGAAILPIKMEWVQAMTALFTEIGKFAAANPETIKAFGVMLGVISAVAVGGAVLALGTAIASMAAAAAPAAIAIGAFGAALGALTALIPHLPSMPKTPGFLPGAGDGMPSYDPTAHPAAAAPQKHSWNVIRPAAGSSQPIHLALMVDREKLGEVIIRDINRRASGPVEGSPYHDPTWSATPLDIAVG
jgi:hypothetical protein